MENRKNVKVDWTRKNHDYLMEDIEKLNKEFNLEKLENLIEDAKNNKN